MSWQAYWDNEGDPRAPHLQDPNDLESLLEREPAQAPEWHFCGAAMPGEYGGLSEACGVALPCPHHPAPGNAYTLELEGRLAAEIKGHNLASTTLSSAADRIKMLEEVLVAIRARAHRGEKEGTPFSALADIMRLVTETLDPHKPWCADDGHEGPCMPKDAGYEGEDE